MVVRREWSALAVAVVIAALVVAAACASKPSSSSPLAADTWKAVAAGPVHTVGIRPDGTLWGWGYNHYGYLGFGGFLHPSPVQVQ